MATERCILLLPSLPQPLSRSSLRSAYKPTLSTLLTKLLPTTKRSISRLDIVLILDSSYDTTQTRYALFAFLQPLVQEVYTLVCLVAAQQSIDLDLPGGLDVRVIFTTQPEDYEQPIPLSGPLVNLTTLASSIAKTTPIYIPESETALSLASAFSNTFRSFHSTNPTIAHLPSGPAVVHSSSSQQAQSPSASTSHIHKSVAVGGTFDHLHIGHKLLLTATLLPASPFPTDPPRKITVGVTDQDLLANKKHASVLESWDRRVERTAEFVESILCFTPDVSRMCKIEQIHNEGVNGRITRYTYTPLPPTTSQGLARTELESSIVINYTLITDPFGPTITDADISAIVISAETRAGGKAVNDKRREKRWNELEVFEVGVLDATPGQEEELEQDDSKVKEGFADKISSTEIRRRLVEMEKQGKL